MGASLKQSERMPVICCAAIRVSRMHGQERPAGGFGCFCGGFVTMPAVWRVNPGLGLRVGVPLKSEFSFSGRKHATGSKRRKVQGNGKPAQ